MQNLNNIVTSLGYLGIEDAAKKHVYMVVMSKISKYESEYNQYKNKYKCEFTALRDSISDSNENENFEIEDDLLNWRFAYEQLEIHRNQLSKIIS